MRYSAIHIFSEGVETVIKYVKTIQH